MRILGVITAVLAFCIMLFAAMPCTAASDPSDPLVIDGFDQDNGLRRSGENVLSLKTGEADPSGNDGTCAVVNCTYAAVGSLRSVTSELGTPLDASEYQYAAYSIFVPAYEADPEAVYYAMLTLYSGDGTHCESLVSVTPDEWNSVECGIGTWQGRDSVIAAELSYTVDSVVGGYTAERFYVDGLSLYGRLDRDMTARFLFDEFSVYGAASEVADDKSGIRFSSDSFAPFGMDADLFMPEFTYGVNCLRFRMANRTDNDSVTLRYTTADTQAGTEDKSVVIPIAPNSEAAYYYAHVGDASMLKSIGLDFEKGNGEVELLSVSAVYYPQADSYITCGSITHCTLNDSRTAVSFKGEVNRDTALSNQDASLSVYVYEKKALPTEDELAAMTPVASCSMSTRFDLTWQLPSDNPSACYGRFIAAVVYTDGSYVLIAPPFHITNPERALDYEDAFGADTKGFAADDISLIGDSGARITLLFVDTDRLFTSDPAGERFVYNGEEYFIDTDYAGVLAQKIDILNRDGIKILLRITENKYVSPDWEKSDGQTVGDDCIGAVSAYIGKNFCADGRVSGVIYGDRENRVFAGETDISEKIAFTARQMGKIYFNLLSGAPDAKLYISVTDLLDADPATNYSELPLNEYIAALYDACAQYGKYDWEIAVEESYGSADEYGKRVDVYNCGELTDMLDMLGGNRKNLIFCDSIYKDPNTRLSKMNERYSLGYYAALFNDRVDAYIANAGARAYVVSETVKYMGTDKAAVVTDRVLQALGADDFGDVVDGYDSASVPSVKYGYGEAFYDEPENIKGKYPYFVFDSVSSIGSVTPDYYCENKRMIRGGSAAMALQLNAFLYGDAVRGSWMGFSHRFDIPENLMHTPVLAFGIKLDGVKPEALASVPVKLVLRGEKGVFEAYGDVKPGDWQTLYFDISEFSDIENTMSVQLLFGDGELDSAALYVRDIVGLSDKYGDESLEDVIASEREKKRSPEAVSDNGIYLWIGGAVSVAALTVIVLAVLSRRKADDGEEE